MAPRSVRVDRWRICRNAAGMTAENPITALPIAQRLALSYAPARCKDATLTLMALDNRLADVLRQRGENALIAQMKLAWWRDRLGQSPQEWPKGEPLLARLRDWPGDVARLIPLVDGWEGLLAEELDSAALAGFCEGRAAAWNALADGLGISRAKTPLEQAVSEWALVDLALHLSPGPERDAMSSKAQSLPWRNPRLDRGLRPIAILHSLARRAVKRGSPELLDGPGALLMALRLGIFGR